MDTVDFTSELGNWTNEKSDWLDASDHRRMPIIVNEKSILQDVKPSDGNSIAAISFLLQNSGQLRQFRANSTYVGYRVHEISYKWT